MEQMAEVDPSTLPVTTELAKRLRSHVAYLASPALKGRKPGTPGNRAAADYLSTQFWTIGLVPLPSLRGYGQQITPELGRNLIGVRPAAARSAPRWLLLGAHYDHLGESHGKAYLGADDNASAVAILLETARLLGSLTHYSLACAAFNTEEPPFLRTPLMGSQYFVDHLPAEIGSPANFQAVIIMDLMGGVYWPPLKNAVFAAGAEKSPALSLRLKQNTATGHGRDLAVLPVGMHLIEEMPIMGQVAFSDYHAFRNVSVQHVFLSAGRTPRYHQTSDLPDTLHYERMALTVTWLQNLIRLIDRDTERYRFEPNRIEFEEDVATFRPLVAQAADWGTRIPGTSLISFLKLKEDAEWLKGLNPADATPQNVRRLERISVRMQCLLTDLPGCFLI